MRFTSEETRIIIKNFNETIEILPNHELRRFLSNGMSEEIFQKLSQKSKEKLKRAKIIPYKPYYKTLNGKTYQYYVFYTDYKFVENTKYDLEARNARYRVIKVKDGWEIFTR